MQKALFLILLLLLISFSIIVGFIWYLNIKTKYISRRALIKRRTIILCKSIIVIILLYVFIIYLSPPLLSWLQVEYGRLYLILCNKVPGHASAICKFLGDKSQFLSVLFNFIIAATIIVFWLQQRSLTKQLQASISSSFNETNRLLWQGATGTPSLGKCFLTQDDWASEDAEMYFLSQRIDWFEYVFLLYDQGIIRKSVWEHRGHYFKKLLLTEPKFRELMLSLDSRDFYFNFFNYAQEIIDKNDLAGLKEDECGRLRDNPQWGKVFNRECINFSKILGEIANEKNVEEFNAVEFGRSLWSKARTNIKEKI
jgi:hypothetical protein